MLRTAKNPRLAAAARPPAPARAARSARPRAASPGPRSASARAQRARASAGVQPSHWCDGPKSHRHLGQGDDDIERSVHCALSAMWAPADAPRPRCRIAQAATRTYLSSLAAAGASSSADSSCTRTHSLPYPPIKLKHVLRLLVIDLVVRT